MASKYARKTPIKEVHSKMVCQNKACQSGGKYLSGDSFYETRIPTMKYYPYCINCVNEMVDINNIDSILSFLKSLNYPFLFEVWNDVLSKNEDNYIEKYIKKMNNSQKYVNLTFDDSQYSLTEEAEIDEKAEEIAKDLLLWSDEWQGEYTRADLNYLNDYYEGLNNDFKIVTTNHKDYARKIAQASLSQMKAYRKMLNGEEGGDSAYEKATKIFDMLSKSAQFAESQRGANDVALGCFGRVFDAVEKHNWVPDYIPTDEDMYDKLLKQFSNIERSL